MPLFVVGAGAAGTALALALRRTEWPLHSLVSRTRAKAEERSRQVGGGAALALDELLAGDLPREPVLLLLSVPDRLLESLAAQLARLSWPGGVALHLSGSAELATLAPLRAAGFALGAAHPLHSFVDPERDADALTRAVIAVEAEAAARAQLQAFTSALGARAFQLAPGSRAAWHAAATHGCNHLVALLDQSLDLMQSAGLPRDDARAALLPLLRATLDNLEHHAPAQALTGPVVRGDVEVVTRHLDALSHEHIDVARGYRALARRALQLAEHGRALDPTLADALRRALAEPSS
ncbi:MAG: NADP oxidoreductase [Planctomycetota bacterium]|nr:MAG: NADP oxidoreductase [Planctomycetota bacterium]